MGNDLKVFAGQSNPALAAGICQSLGIDPGLIEFLSFSNENIKVKICENVRGCDVFFIQTSCQPVSDCARAVNQVDWHPIKSIFWKAVAPVLDKHTGVFAVLGIQLTGPQQVLPL